MSAPGTPREELELSPGDRCEAYRIVALLAAGGMGDVYEAVHEPTGRTVAVKCMKLRHRQKEDSRARMKMEAVVLSELQHENLVQVFDAGVTDTGMVWIAMERLHGQTLRDLLFRTGKLPVSEALHYASEIADGVDAVHEVNVIHRDLKPENVFVTTTNVVKVLDLGTGKFTGYGLNSTDRMRVIGTTAYMSPEQIKGLRVDGRADVYALGLMVYEMIAGRHPLAPDDGAPLPQGLEQIAIMQLQMTPKSLARVARECPTYVSAMVDRAIAKDRDRRFPNMATFARELRSLRKRFVAENPENSANSAPLGEDLREKFGAPPRSSEHPPRRTPNRSRSASERASAPPQEGDTVADIERVHGPEFSTEIQAATPSALDHSAPGPEYVPTQILSSTSVPLPPEENAPGDFTLRGLPPDEVRNRTTQTNPIGFVRAASEPSDDSLEAALRGRPWLPILRRAGATLALGAIIGIPPAIGGVLWARHRNTTSSAVSAPSLARDRASIAGSTVAASDPPSTVGSLAGTIAVTACSGGPGSVASSATAPSTSAPVGSLAAEVLAVSVATNAARSASEGVLVRPPRQKVKSPLVSPPAVVDENSRTPPDLKRSRVEPPADDAPKTVLPPSGL